jgi:hypothetical protein
MLEKEMMRRSAFLLLQSLHRKRAVDHDDTNANETRCLKTQKTLKDDKHCLQRKQERGSGEMRVMCRNELQKQKLEKHYHAGLKALACGALVCDDYNKVCFDCTCRHVVVRKSSRMMEVNDLEMDENQSI